MAEVIGQSKYEMTSTLVKFETAILVATSANINVEQAGLNFDKFIDESKISIQPIVKFFTR